MMKTPEFGFVVIGFAEGNPNVLGTVLEEMHTVQAQPGECFEGFVARLKREFDLGPADEVMTFWRDGVLQYARVTKKRRYSLFGEGARAQPYKC